MIFPHTDLDNKIFKFILCQRFSWRFAEQSMFYLSSLYRAVNGMWQSSGNGCGIRFDTVRCCHQPHWHKNKLLFTNIYTVSSVSKRCTSRTQLPSKLISYPMLGWKPKQQLTPKLHWSTKKLNWIL